MDLSEQQCDERLAAITKLGVKCELYYDKAKGYKCRDYTSLLFRLCTKLKLQPPEFRKCLGEHGKAYYKCRVQDKWYDSEEFLDRSNLCRGGKQAVSRLVMVQMDIPSGSLGDTLESPTSSSNVQTGGDIAKYERVNQVGQGRFGGVFKARHRKTRHIVALKKIVVQDKIEGFPSAALNELKILKHLKHENVIELIEMCDRKNDKKIVFAKSDTMYLVLEYCDYDLAELLTNQDVQFSLGQMKKIMQMLLRGLCYIHKKNILHRNMEAANILITRNGVLKLADFSLAREVYPVHDPRVKKYTNGVITLWYRAPELLLGDTSYGPPIDMWAAGCLMAQLWTRYPIMMGTTEQQQLNLIIDMCGTINTDVWHDAKSLPLFDKLELNQSSRRKLIERLFMYVKDMKAIDLIDKLLILNPTKRYDAYTALNHFFFRSDPLPCELRLTHQPIKFTEQAAAVKLPVKVEVG